MACVRVTSTNWVRWIQVRILASYAALCYPGQAVCSTSPWRPPRTRRDLSSSPSQDEHSQTQFSYCTFCNIQFEKPIKKSLKRNYGIFWHSVLIKHQNYGILWHSVLIKHKNYGILWHSVLIKHQNYGILWHSVLIKHQNYGILWHSVPIKHKNYGILWHSILIKHQN